MTHKQFAELMAAKNGPFKVARPVKMQPVLPPSVFEGERIVVVLPLPDQNLHPNGRTAHWSEKHRLNTEALTLAFVTTKEALHGAMPKWDKAIGYCRIYLTRHNVADKGEIRAWFKGYIDGIAQAGVVKNDIVIDWEKDYLGADRTMPRVEIELRKA